MNIPLHVLPFAAAALDRDRVIVAANQRFVRLCGPVDSNRTSHRLADIVAEPDRPAVEHAFERLTVLENRTPQRRSVKALRATAPSLWLAIDVARLGPESAVPYLACLQALPRRPTTYLPRRRARGPKTEEPCSSTGFTSSSARTLDSWPPLLTNLSHELRGPLAAIRGWTEMATRGLLTADRMSEAFTVIGRNAASLSEMIDNLFDMSRRAAGSLVLERQVLDVNALAQGVVESALPTARHRNVTLTVKRAPETLFVKGDALRLEQVVRNLLENAMKFTPSGGHVHVHTGSDGAFAEIVVTDNGPGISPDLLSEIFEPFRHDDAILQPSERGLGLGLALVRELVQLHDGEVRAISGGKGQGSTFIVRLPLAKTAAAA